MPGGNAGASPGAIAQLGERLNGIQEVVGSIPIISTKFKTLKLKVSFKVFSLWQIYISFR